MRAALQGFHSAKEERKGPTTVRERLRGEQSELNWLMRTSYIAHDAPGKAKQRDASALSNGDANDASSRQELLDDIEVHAWLWRIPNPGHLWWSTCWTWHEDLRPKGISLKRVGSRQRPGMGAPCCITASASIEFAVDHRSKLRLTAHAFRQDLLRLNNPPNIHTTHLLSLWRSCQVRCAHIAMLSQPLNFSYLVLNNVLLIICGYQWLPEHSQL